MKDVHIIIRDDLFDYGNFSKNPIGVVDYSPETITHRFKENGLDISIRAPGIKDVKPDKLGGKVHRRYVAANHMQNKGSAPTKRNNVPRYWVHMKFKKLSDAVRTLTGRQQQVLHFKFIERDKNKEIARTLDLTEGYIEQCINDIYKKLTVIYNDPKRTWAYNIMVKG